MLIRTTRSLAVLIVSLLAAIVIPTGASAANSTVEGVVEVVVVDDKVTRSGDELVYLRSSGRRYLLRGEAGLLERLHDRSGRTIRVRGSVGTEAIAVEGLLAANGGPLPPQTGTGPTQVPPPAGFAADGSPARTFAVILVNFPDNRVRPWTAANMRDTLVNSTTSVDQLYRQSTGNAVRFAGRVNPAGDIFGWYELNVASSPCDSTAHRNAAITAAAADGFDAANYQHVIVVFPHTSACFWSGLAHINDKWSTINEQTPSVGTIAHELGHNLGLAHSSKLWCVDGAGAYVPISTECTIQEYGNPYDVMGWSSARHTFMGYHRIRLNSLQTPRVLDVSASGTYRIGNLAGTSADPTTLRIERATNSASRRHYYVDLRHDHGVFDQFPAGASSITGSPGVTLHLATEPQTYQYTPPYLIDMRPATSLSDDAPMRVGETYTDTRAGLAVRLVSMDAQAATLDVTIAPSPGTPSTPTNVRALTVSNFGATIAWDASTDDVGVTDYAVYRDGVFQGSTDATSLEVGGLTRATQYQFTVVASDRAANESAASTPLTITTLNDTTAPTQVPRVWTTSMTNGVMSLAWEPATDANGIERYAIYRGVPHTDNWSLRAEVPGTQTTWVDPNLATHTQVMYKIYAFDPAANASISKELSAWLKPALPNACAVLDTIPAAITPTSVQLTWEAPPCAATTSLTYDVRTGRPATTTVGSTTARTFTAPATLGANARESVEIVSRAGVNQYTGVTMTVRNTTTGTPAAPPAGSVVHTGSTAQLSWAVSGASPAPLHFVVYRDGASVGVTNGTSYVDTSVPAGAHTWTVRSVGQNLTFSAPTTMGLPDTQAPTAPTVVWATHLSGGMASISWPAATDNVGVSGYELFVDGVFKSTHSSTSAIVTGLTGGTRVLTVRARDAAGNLGPFSPPTNLFVDLVAPTAPTNIQATVGFGGTVNVTWTAATDNVSVTGYEISVDGVARGTASGTSGSVTAVAAGTRSISVRARDAVTNYGPFGTPRSVYVDRTNPSTPVGVTAAHTGGGSVAVSWQPATDDVGVQLYRVFVDGVVRAIANAPLTSITLSGITDGSHTFQVRARDAIGNESAFSTSVSVLVDATPPTAPGAPTFTLYGNGDVRAMWVASFDAVGPVTYDVYVDGVLRTVSTPNTDALFFGLAQGYHAVTVIARDGAGLVSASSQESFHIDRTAPTAPSDVSAAHIGGGSVSVTWSASGDNVAVAEYWVYVDGQLAIVVPASQLSTILPGITDGTHAITVRARDAQINTSGASVAANVTVDTTAPTVPTGVTATHTGGGTVSVSWTASTDATGVASYEVLVDGAVRATTAGTSTTIAGVAAGTHDVTVRAFDAYGNTSAASASSTVVVTLVDTTPPSVPTGIAAVHSGSGTVNVTWGASTDDVAVTAYEVFLDGLLKVSPATPTATLTGVSAGTHAITIRARDARGNLSGLSAPYSIFVDRTAPSVPQGVTASHLGGGSVTVAWTASTDNVAVTEYEVLVDGVVRATTAATSTIVPALSDGTRLVRVRARDAAKNTSGLSSQRSVLVDTVPPTQVTGLAASSIARTSFTLSWGASTDALGTVKYAIHRNGVFVKNVSTTSTTISGLVRNTTYSMTVVAYDPSGNQAQASLPLSVRTAP